MSSVPAEAQPYCTVCGTITKTIKKRVSYKALTGEPVYITYAYCSKKRSFLDKFLHDHSEYILTKNRWEEYEEWCDW